MSIGPKPGMRAHWRVYKGPDHFADFNSYTAAKQSLRGYMAPAAIYLVNLTPVETVFPDLPPDP